MTIAETSNTRQLGFWIALAALLWALTAMNIVGIRLAGSVQIVTTILKLMPLVVVVLGTA